MPDTLCLATSLRSLALNGTHLLSNLALSLLIPRVSTTTLRRCQALVNLISKTRKVMRTTMKDSTLLKLDGAVDTGEDAGAAMVAGVATDAVAAGAGAATEDAVVAGAAGAGAAAVVVAGPRLAPLLKLRLIPVPTLNADP